MNGITQAPASSKGANGPKNPTVLTPETSVHLDWLRYSYHYPSDMPIADALRIAMPRTPEFVLTGEMVHNASGYDSAMALSFGVIHWHSKNVAEGISVELPGSALSDMRTAGVSEIFVLEHIAHVLGKVSTMDSAVDVYHSGGSHRDVIAHRDAGTLITRARHVNEFAATKRIKGVWDPEGTCYVGSPKSPVEIKIYNAFKKHGGPIEDWIRVEIRWRSRHAQAAHRAMLEFGIADVTRKAILNMLDLQEEWFQHAMRGGLVVIEPVRRLETDTVKWLIDIVAPVLERNLMKERGEGGRAIYEKFDAILKSEYKARNRKVNNG